MPSHHASPTRTYVSIYLTPTDRCQVCDPHFSAASTAYDDIYHTFIDITTSIDIRTSGRRRHQSLGSSIATVHSPRFAAYFVVF